MQLEPFSLTTQVCLAALRHLAVEAERSSIHPYTFWSVDWTPALPDSWATQGRAITAMLGVLAVEPGSDPIGALDIKILADDGDGDEVRLTLAEAEALRAWLTEHLPRARALTACQVKR